MGYLDAALVAESRRQGRAVRSATLRHRYLAKRPLGLVLWQLGAEPFTAAAAAWGFGPKKRDLACPGEPRDRELAFRALARLARDFNEWFESGGEQPPQVIVPNAGNLALLRRLGRRLAYLPLEGERAADPELVRFGLHLRFLGDHSRRPGQQLVVVLTELLSNHWVSELAALEVQSLPALDAAIDPPKGVNAHAAAAVAERIEIGPVPSEADDRRLSDLLTAFNEARERRTDEKLVARLRRPIEAHYDVLVNRAWPLIWRCVERERTWTEAGSVARRVQEDIEALEWHLDFTRVKGGRYRTRYTNTRAARTLRVWEEQTRLVAAEEALDDPLRMIPYLLNSEAIVGKVVATDLEHRETPGEKSVLRPRITIETVEPCMVAAGKQLYWTDQPESGKYTMVEIEERSGCSRVTLQHETSSSKWDHPTKGCRATFSIHHRTGDPPLKLPFKLPWTHRAHSSAPAPADIETDEDLT